MGAAAHPELREKLVDQLQAAHAAQSADVSCGIPELRAADSQAEGASIALVLADAARWDWSP
jgi:hypothetical protein